MKYFILFLIVMLSGCSSVLQTSRVYDCRSGECSQVAEVKTNGYVKVTLEDNMTIEADHKTTSGLPALVGQALGMATPIVIDSLLDD